MNRWASPIPFACGGTRAGGCGCCARGRIPSSNRARSRMTSCSFSKTPTATRRRMKFSPTPMDSICPPGLRSAMAARTSATGASCCTCAIRPATAKRTNAWCFSAALGRATLIKQSTPSRGVPAANCFSAKGCTASRVCKRRGAFASWTSTAHGDCDRCAANCTRTGAPPAAAIRGGLRLAIGASRLLKATARASANCCRGWWPVNKSWAITGAGRCKLAPRKLNR